jgi:predicted Zn-dependent protease
VVLAVLAAVAVGTQPLLVQWHSARGLQFLRARAYDRALDELQAAIWLAPERAESYLLLARLHRRTGHAARAPALLRQAEKRGADAGRVQREKLLLLAQTGQLREAEPHLANLLVDPRGDGEEICEAYVQGYFANLRVAEATRLLDAWQAEYPQSAQPHFMRAYLLQALALRPEAVTAYRQGLALAPGEPLMEARLATVLTEMGQFDEAGVVLRAGRVQSPKNPEIAFAWANYLFLKGDLEEARRALSDLVVRRPGHVAGQRLLGQIELAQGRYTEALRQLEAAVRLQPHDVATRNALGRTLRALGRAEDARPHFDFVVEAERTQTRLDRLFRQVFERPADSELRCEIGVALLKSGSPDDGAKWLRSVLELQPDHVAAHQALAAYCETRRDFAGAQAHRQQARERAPRATPNK